MGNPNIQILLSTYNGEKYLEEQLDSLLTQKNVNIHILIRDDGSKDNTVFILHKYASEYPSKISVTTGSNLGVKQSFYELLSIASSEYDYYAFCDQDDVWLSNKLSNAVQKLQEIKNEPGMYCSSTQMVNEQLEPIKVWPTKPRKKLSLYNSLIENTCVGCTIVLNPEASKLIKQNPPEIMDNMIMHDWWMYLTISALGKVVFDTNPGILYRQHQNNVLGGASESFFIKWINRVKRFWNGKNHYILSTQAHEFLKVFNKQLNKQQIAEIERLLLSGQKNIVIRFVYTMNTKLYRQSKIDNVVFKILFVLGKV
ncbi:glycosyltransferase family 2 protein [Paenibacillus polygoni]|uniref:Glycosyltransferase family 2 protein n=1 Tax=Paenibacillus polygoni TaxID=3050112 RepID=A0ABY8X6M6_9BACL|nr:glycosyltransferase family 2 protein [Paenibacillus polygoni]WIV18850.1 glycosyltransferase family 2 protein [Paenibacillus polygoni]